MNQIAVGLALSEAKGPEGWPCGKTDGPKAKGEERRPDEEVHALEGAPPGYGLRSSAKVSVELSEPSGSLLKFFFLSYALMWACFITVAAAHISAHGALGYSLLLLGAFAPAISALWITGRAHGGAGVSKLVGHIGQVKVAARYYIFALSYTVAIKLTSALLLRIVSGAWPRFGNFPIYLVPAAIAFSTPFQAGEEIGWRGYALPRLAARMGLRRASVLLGIIWAIWHLPQFVIPEGDTYHQSFVVFGLGTTALSVALAWLWARTRQSLLLPMLMHAAVNNSKDIVPSATVDGSSTFGLAASPVAWLTVLLMWTCAAYLLVRMPRGNSLPGTPTA